MSYVKAILCFMIASTLVEQLIPNKSYLPYIKVVIGCMLLTMVLHPMLYPWNTSKFGLDQFIDAERIWTESDFESDAQNAYQTSVAKTIKEQLEQEGILAEDIEVSLHENQTIDSISITGKDAKKQEKKIKLILMNFYNLKNHNINISE